MALCYMPATTLPQSNMVHAVLLSASRVSNKFYVVEHTTVILGVTNSEKHGLIKVNFDAINAAKSVKIVHSIGTSESFKHEMENEFPELFKGIGCMEGEIHIKLKEGAVPHVEPIRQAPYAM